MSNGEPAGVQSVDRALTILERLARSGEAGVTEIANEIGVHKSTAFRLVATLESHRLVEQTEERGSTDSASACSGWLEPPPRGWTWSRKPGRCVVSSPPTRRR